MVTTSFAETYHGLAFLLDEEEMNFSRDNIVMKAGVSGTVVKAGTVLSKYTSTADVGKYVVGTTAGATGTDTCCAVLCYDTLITADAAAVAITRKAQVNQNLLIFGSTIDDSTKKATAITQLKAVGIIARSDLDAPEGD